MHKYLLLLIFLPLFNTLIASPDYISEEAFIYRLKKALEDSWSYETGQIDVEIKQIEADNSRKKYEGFKLDLKSSIELAQIHKGSTSQTSEYSKNQFEQKNQIYLLGTKRFLNNPTRLSFSVNRTDPWSRHSRWILNDRAKNYRDFSHKNYLTVKWEIPLLKHTNGASEFKTYQKDELDLEGKKLAYEEEQEAFIAKLLSKFYDLALHQQTHKLYNAYIDALSSLDSKEKKEAPSVALALLKAEIELAKSFKRLENIQAEIALRLDYPEFLNKEIIIERDTTLNPLPNLETFVRDGSRTLKKIDVLRKIMDIEIAYYKNQSRNTLDLTFSGSHLEENGSKKRNTFAENINQYHVGLEYKMPIMGHQLNKGKLRVSELKMSKINNKYRRAQISLMAKIKTLENSLINQKKTLQSYMNFSDTLTKNEQQAIADHQDDKSSSVNNLISSMKDALEAKVKTLEVLIAYKKEQVALDNSLDRLLLSEN